MLLFTSLKESISAHMWVSMHAADKPDHVHVYLMWLYITRNIVLVNWVVVQFGYIYCIVGCFPFRVLISYVQIFLPLILSSSSADEVPEQTKERETDESSLNKVVTPKLTSALHRTKMSDHNATFVIVKTAKSLDHNTAYFAVRHDTIQRGRQKHRENKAQDLKDYQMVLEKLRLQLFISHL